MMYIILLVLCFGILVWVMWNEPLIGDGDDLPLEEEIDDSHLSHKEKDFYKQVQLKRKKDENKN